MAVQGSGRRLKTRKWMISMALYAAEGGAIPIFVSNRLNRKLARIEDKIKQQKTHKRNK